MGRNITTGEKVCILILSVILLGALFYKYIFREEETRISAARAAINIKERFLSRIRSGQMEQNTGGRPVARATPILYKYEVKVLIGREYFPALRSALRGAKKFIKVAMFVIDRGDYKSDPSNTLVEDLVAARKRGVEVSAILEHPWGKKAPELMKKNGDVINYLKKHGIDANFDEPNYEMHDKLVVIDDKVIFIGNHNWTKESLTINDEVSVVIRPEPPDPQFSRQFNYITRLSPEDTEEGREKHLKELQEKLLKRSGQ